VHPGCSYTRCYAAEHPAAWGIFRSSTSPLARSSEEEKEKEEEARNGLRNSDENAHRWF
jgi:hypothetical protein